MWPSLDVARRAPRAGERGEGEAGRAAGWAETEAGLAQQRLSLLYFFLKFFSQFLSKLIWLLKNHFHPFPPKAKLLQNKNPTTLF